ncbi:sugar ABC transporter substrate-binding protein [Pseudoalteromonas sp. CO342X]|uniref:ABC transporter substrate-binding protein n=1 Tax=Pseudoalteromonas sp. CO342X TaxID=1777270 RepID=UPI001023AF06|nr:ABC transporter substrate-binding protein [Pseudoalteromonas sp. CO342X]RZG12597.1 sugar ABC transporter substrate-binding protein [Pseudoalteromonas sp. CO342X]
MIKKVLIGLVLWMVCFSVDAKQSLNVLFVNPSVPGEPFWQRVQGITEAAADQFDIRLDVIYGEGNRIIQLAELKKYLSYRATPDYVILINYPGGAEESLKLLEKYGINHITLEETISGPERLAIGNPKEHYKYWLGEVHHDNDQAGYDLAKKLYQQAKTNGHETIYPIAINGHYGTESDIRSNGAKRFFDEVGVVVQQTVYAGWSKEQALDKTKKLLHRYPKTNLIWCASDLMAMGAITAAASSTSQIVFGGFDWLSDTFELIEHNEMHASVGGHFMMGAWALISVYDHYYGHPFWKDNAELAFDLSVITKENLADYYWIKSAKNWQSIDYKAMSLRGKPKEQYHFSPELLRKSLQK